MVTREVTIESRTGLHARPAALLVEKANKFEAELKLIHDEREADLKSIMSLMALAVREGEKVILKAQGVDAEKAVNQLSELIEGDLAGS